MGGRDRGGSERVGGGIEVGVRGWRGEEVKGVKERWHMMGWKWEEEERKAK